MQFRVVMQDMAAHDLSWVLHVGDIFWRPCSEEMYRRHLGWFNELPHPVIYTPGDNEWANCWEPGSGAYTPLGRLDRIRAMFFEDPTGSLGGRNLPLVSQGGQPPFPELVENARWTAQGIVFATVHLVGSRNARDPFPGRTAADDRESRQRTDAAATWIGEAFAEAAELDAVAVVPSSCTRTPTSSCRQIAPTVGPTIRSWRCWKTKPSDSAGRCWSPTATTTTCWSITRWLGERPGTPSTTSPDFRSPARH